MMYMGNPTNHQDAVQMARARYRRSYLMGCILRWWLARTTRSPQVLPYVHRPQEQPRAGDQSRVQAIAIDQIYGTAQRHPRVDARFRPIDPGSAPAWQRIAMAWQRGEVLPPVELIATAKGYIVRDGHLRISVARAMGQAYIDALVVTTDVADQPREPDALWIRGAALQHQPACDERCEVGQAVAAEY